jgi:hypothetical protein
MLVPLDTLMAFLPPTGQHCRLHSPSFLLPRGCSCCDALFMNMRMISSYPRRASLDVLWKEVYWKPSPPSVRVLIIPPSSKLRASHSCRLSMRQTGTSRVELEEEACIHLDKTSGGGPKIQGSAKCQSENPLFDKEPLLLELP